MAGRAVGSSVGSHGRASWAGDATTSAFVTTSFETKSRAPRARACAAHSKRACYECITQWICRGQRACRERAPVFLQAEVRNRKPERRAVRDYESSLGRGFAVSGDGHGHGHGHALFGYFRVAADPTGGQGAGQGQSPMQMQMQMQMQIRGTPDGFAGHFKLSPPLLPRAHAHARSPAPALPRKRAPARARKWIQKDV